MANAATKNARSSKILHGTPADQGRVGNSLTTFNKNFGNFFSKKNIAKDRNFDQTLWIFTKDLNFGLFLRESIFFVTNQKIC